MLRLLYIGLFSIIFNNLISQIVVNEIILENDQTLKIEIFNSFANVENIRSITVRSDTFQITKEFLKFLVQPAKFSLLEFKLSYPVPGFEKISINICTNRDQFSTNYDGYVLKGESAGRYPDVKGEFIIYDNIEITPGKANFNPGIFVKKTSKTKFSPRDSSPNAALYYNDFYWIFGGWDYNEESGTWSSKTNVWRSKDGLDWSLINPHPPFPLPYCSYVVFKNKMMIFYQDTVFITEDGISWDKHTCHAFNYENYRYIVFKNELYCFSFNYMWKSHDGINWTFYITDFPWDEIRYLPAMVASEDRFWMYGGGLDNRDVWNSYDGLHWEKVLDVAPWIPRIWFNFTYFDNKIWMIGGNDENVTDSLDFGNLRDCWYSSDGVNWNLLDFDTTYHNRHGCFLWNDGKRVLMSSGFGNDYINRMYNDVWELDPAFSLTSPAKSDKQTLCINTSITDITYAIKGGTGATASGLPEGVKGSFKEGIFTISGVPTVSGTFNYTVIITGPYDLPSEEGNITVNPADEDISVSSLSGALSQTICIKTPLTDILYEISGGSGATVSGLPPGVRYSYEGGFIIIRGAPTVSGTFNYAVTVKDHCFNPAAAGTITVNPDATISMISESGANSQTVCLNTPLKDIRYNIADGTYATVSGLPENINGLYMSGVFIISGIPERLGNFSYKIAASGNCAMASAEGSLRVINTQIFPNPSNGTIKIFYNGQFSIRILDLAGHQLFYGTYFNEEDIFEKDFSDIFKTNGLYLITIESPGIGYTYSKKIVIAL